MPELLVRRDDPGSAELARGESLRDGLADGEAQLQIERFAITTNNLTYAALGERLGYWQLFPAPDGWGSIPAWGYARVLTSRAEATPQGQRVFGLVPMASYLTVRPESRRGGFTDRSAHRASLAPVYNDYLYVPDDADDAMLIMRPLLGTSLLLDLALADTDFHGADTVVVTSASSKTAYGLAHLLRARPVRVVGLTSPSHREWVHGLGLYDTVLSYEQLHAIPDADGTVIIDFAGSATLLRTLNKQLGRRLLRTVRVGMSHRDAAPADGLPTGPRVDVFFAPDEMARHGAELAQHWPATWRTFAPVVKQALHIERLTSPTALLRAYQDLYAGRSDPAAGYIATL
jgi:NADPH:quinone reductase-like Zn-dependent oxidoreductase